MASYLGKISAIVSANTAGYVRGLNEAATQTRAFAQTVQNDINRASKQADRSLKSILTPLQQFQRSLNAAVSERLAFKGVDGIVTGIGQLQTKLRELQRQGSRTVDVALNISGRSSVDQLIEDLDVLDSKKVQAVIEAVNTESINRAKAQLEQLYSVANEIAKPLAAAAQQFDKLGLSVQASFIPALNVAQTAVQELEAKIREGGRVSQDEFDRVARVVDRTTAAVRRLADAQDLVNALPTGQELRFQDPRLSQRLQAAGQAASAAASLPAGTIESAGITQIVAQLRQASDFALETKTRLENARALGLTEDAARISSQLDNATETVDRITRKLQASGSLTILSDDDLRRSRDSELAASLERDQQAAQELAATLAGLREQAAFAITGRVQNFEQVRQQLSRIIAQVGELDAATTASFDLDIGTLNRILSEGEVDDLATAQAIIDRIVAALGQRRTLDLDAETAQREADQLAATIDRLRANADFAITGRPQNLDQVQSELQRILGTIDRLNDQQRGELRVSAVIDAINAGDLQQAQQALADLKRQVESGAEFNINAEQAKKAAEDVRNRLMAIDDRIEFTITGRVQNFDQARQELSAVLGDVSRLEQAQKQAFGQRLQAVGEIIESTEIGKLDQAANILQEIRSEIAGINGSPIRNPLGASLDDPIRQVDVLKGGINSLQGQLDNLPAPIRQRFLPELRRLRDQFTQAEKSPQRFGQELENAADDVRRLSAEVRRISQAQGLGSFADGLDDTALRGAIGNLQALQQILNRVGATAGSEGAKQFDRLRAAIQRATDEGIIGSQAFQDELQEITQDAAAAAAATGKIGQKAAFREIQRGGDIARGGFDKFSLAAQQAAFAIDDFFSATGDFSQKIRAVQNNITQLAFIVGSTEGLFLALGASIAAQAAVALFKWSQNSVEAEDKTQALNDALARQKSLVEELKQAFDSLGDSLTRGIFDEATERARQFENQIKEIQQRSQELEQERFASLDEDVQRERGFQASRQAMLEQETDAGRRVTLQSQIEQSRRREEAAAQRAAAQQAPALDEIRRSVIDGILSQIDAEFGSSGVGSDFEFRAAGERARRAFESAGLSSTVSESGAARVDAGSGFSDVFEAASGLQGRIDDIASRIQELDAGFFTADGVFTTASQEREVLDQEIARLSQILQQLESPLREALTNLRLDILDSAQEISGTLRASGDIVAGSLGGFGPLAVEQRSLAAEFGRITSELAAGATAGADGVFGTDDDVALTRETTEARKEELQRIRDLVTGNLSAVRSTEAFSNALDRLAGDLADTVLGEAQSAEQQARRDVNRRQAELNTLPADATPRERLNATARLRDAQQRQAELAASADDIAARRRQLAGRQAFEVEQFQQQARAGNLGDDLQRQIRARDAIQGRIDAGQNVASVDRARLAELTASIADAFENSLAGVQLAAEADALDVRQQEVQQQAEERQRSVESGLELIRPPEPTAALRGLDQFNDAINGALSLAAGKLKSIDPNLPQLDDGFLSLQELGTLFSDFPDQIGATRELFFADLQQARDNITGNISAQIAQIAQFDAERSRPSRQALQAQDINTQQGRAELNRLLRGDDANRDQPILQGIKEQTAILKLIDQRIDEVNRVVGVAGA